MALKGNQKKLDKNNNNRIDAQDFKILKAEKAKGRGQGLQDEKMKPGKPMKAVLGAIALGAAGALGAKKMLKRRSSKSKTGMTGMGGMAANLVEQKKKELMQGKKVGGEMKKDPTKPINPADRGMKKRMAERAIRAAKATKVGKIAAGVAGVGLAAKAYLNKKLEESRAKKKAKGKMGGGMMQKYAEGGDAKRSPVAEKARRMGQRKPKPGPLGRAGRGVGKKKKESLGQAQFKTYSKEKNTQFSKAQRVQKTYEGASPTIKADLEKRFSGVYKPTEIYSSSRRDAAKTFMRVGGSVTVKTKLGRNKPTKMY